MSASGVSRQVGIYFAARRLQSSAETPSSSVSCILFWLAAAGVYSNQHLSRATGNSDKQFLPSSSLLPLLARGPIAIVPLGAPDRRKRFRGGRGFSGTRQQLRDYDAPSYRPVHAHTARRYFRRMQTNSLVWRDRMGGGGGGFLFTGRRPPQLSPHTGKRNSPNT